VNQCIARDERIVDSLGEFAGQCLEVRCKAPEVNVSVVFFDQFIRLQAHSGEEPAIPANAIVHGTLAALLGLLVRRDGSSGLVDPNIRITGDIEFVRGVYDLAGTLRINWQDPLSDVIGDIPTQQLENVLSSVSSYSRGTLERVKQNLDDYLHEESQWFPNPVQLDIFKDDLDSLRLRIDRLEARAGQIRGRLAKLSEMKQP